MYKSYRLVGKMFEQTFKKMLENFKVILVELMLLKKIKVSN